MNFKLTIKPAVPVEMRHSIEDFLMKAGYNVHGGGTHAHLSECDITFSDKVVDEPLEQNQE